MPSPSSSRGVRHFENELAAGHEVGVLNRLIERPAVERDCLHILVLDGKVPGDDGQCLAARKLYRRLRNLRRA